MRKSVSWPIAVFAIALIASPAAFALSVDRDTSMNTDGTPKFTDPDDQMPNFMTGGAPEDQPTPQARPSIALPMTPDANAGLSVFGSSQQPDSFDRAFQQK